MAVSVRVAVALVGLLAPLAATLATLTGAPLGTLGVLGALALIQLAAAIARPSPGATRLGPPALLFLSIVGTSLAAVILARQQVGLPAGASPIGAGILAGGVALAWAMERIARQDQRVLPAAVAGLFVGHAVASLLTLRALLDTAGRAADPVAAFAHLLVTVRAHSQFDINAAASSLVLVILAAGGWAWQTRAYWVVAVMPLPLVGLWLTGGRITMVAMLVAAVGTAAFQSLRRGSGVSRRGVVTIGVVITVVAVVAAALLQSTTRNIPVSASVESRLLLWQTGGRMVADAPATGVGVGRFHELSADYGAGAIREALGTSRTRDNAHNYFVQIAAELGLVGLAGFLWLVTRIWPPPQQWRDLPVAQLWLCAGLIANGLTWLTSHPLLEPMGAFVFWMAAGVVASAGSAHTLHRSWRIATVVVALAIPLSVWWQAERLRDAESLEHHGRGVSLWQPEVDGERYRVATAGASVFVPTGHTIMLPVRIAPGGPTSASVAVLVEGVRINQVPVAVDRWTDIKLSIRPARRRFVEVHLDAPGQPTLWIGRAEAREMN